MAKLCASATTGRIQRRASSSKLAIKSTSNECGGICDSPPANFTVTVSGVVLCPGVTLLNGNINGTFVVPHLANPPCTWQILIGQIFFVVTKNVFLSVFPGGANQNGVVVVNAVGGVTGVVSILLSVGQTFPDNAICTVGGSVTNTLTPANCGGVTAGHSGGALVTPGP